MTKKTIIIILLLLLSNLSVGLTPVLSTYKDNRTDQSTLESKTNHTSGTINRAKPDKQRETPKGQEEVNIRSRVKGNTHVDMELMDLISHDPIEIDGNDDFAAQVTANGWDGDGTENNPYKIQNYHIVAAGPSGIKISNTDVYFFIKYCLIEYATSSGKAGIELHSVTNGYIRNNSITNNNHGVSLYDSSSNTISNNTINDNDYAIYLSGSNNTIRHNIIKNNEEGIALFSDTNYVIGNTIVENNKAISLFGSSSNIITKNIVNNTAQYGIRFSGGSNNNTINNNTITSTSKIFYNYENYGILLSGGSCNTIFNNTIMVTSETDDRCFGIYLSVGLNNTIYNNIVINTFEYGDTHYGIVVSSDSNYIVSNIIKNQEYYGVFISGSNNIFSHNIIMDNSNQGIYLLGSNNTISRNIITNNNMGIFIKDSQDEANTIKFNIVKENTHDGIRVENSYYTKVNRNELVANGGYGINLTDCIFTAMDDNIFFTNNAGTINIDGGSNNEIIDTFAPEITGPTNHTFEQGIPSILLSWVAKDGHPDTYSIYRNNTGISSGTWSSHVTINHTVSDALPFGLYNYTMIVTDTSDHYSAHTVWITVIEPTPPNILSSPDDCVYEYGDDISLTWSVYDDNPSTYDIYVDDLFIVSSSWYNDELISIYLLDHLSSLSLGIVNITLIFWDLADCSTSSSVFVTVVDTTAPVLTSSSTDFTYEYGESGFSLNWTVSDYHPAHYVLYQNGTIIQSDDWSSDITLSYALPSLAVGLYNHSIIFFDTSDNSVVHIVFVTVVDTTLPMITSDPLIDDPFIIEQNDKGYVLNWTVSDYHPDEFTIYLNETTFDQDSWTSPSSLIYSLDDICTLLGVYNFTLLIGDLYGNSAIDTILVTVIEPVPPNILSSPDVSSIEYGTNVSLDWLVVDHNPSFYLLYVDDFVVVNSSWSSNISVSYSIDDLDLGFYNLTIVFFDTLRLSVSSTVLLTIVDTTSPVISNVTHTPSDPTTLDDITITARVTDNYAVAEVVLFYRLSGHEWISVPMQAIGNDRYSITLGSFRSSTLEFYIHAVDSEVNSFQTSSFSFSITYQMPLFLLIFIILSSLSLLFFVPTFIFARKRGFSSFFSYLSASKLGFKTLEDYQGATKLGFPTKNDQRKAERVGFSTMAEWQEAESKGFLSFVEVELAHSLNQPNKSSLLHFITNDLDSSYKQFKKQFSAIQSEYDNIKTNLDTLYNAETVKSYQDKLHRYQSSLISQLKKQIEQYSVIEDPSIEKRISQLEAAMTAFSTYFSSIDQSLQNRLEYLTTFSKMIDLLNTVKPDLPVVINRIVELSGIPKESAIDLLKDIIAVDPSIGEYFDLEQVFIRRSSASLEIDKLLQQYEQWEQDKLDKKD